MGKQQNNPAGVGIPPAINPPSGLQSSAKPHWLVRIYRDVGSWCVRIVREFLANQPLLTATLALIFFLSVHLVAKYWSSPAVYEYKPSPTTPSESFEERKAAPWKFLTTGIWPVVAATASTFFTVFLYECVKVGITHIGRFREHTALCKVLDFWSPRRVVIVGPDFPRWPAPAPPPPVGRENFPKRARKELGGGVVPLVLPKGDVLAAVDVMSVCLRFGIESTIEPDVVLDEDSPADPLTPKYRQRTLASFGNGAVVVVVGMFSNEITAEICDLGNQMFELEPPPLEHSGFGGTIIIKHSMPGAAAANARYSKTVDHDPFIITKLNIGSTTCVVCAGITEQSTEAAGAYFREHFAAIPDLRDRRNVRVDTNPFVYVGFRKGPKDFERLDLLIYRSAR